MACAASTEAPPAGAADHPTERSGTLDRRWRLAPQVAVRPEPFGALVYHFGTRRFTFLKSQLLLDVVGSLAEHDSARDACRDAGVAEDELPRYERALATLVDTGMIVTGTDS
jgi:mycofactocin biosynthesis protein MftB